MIPLVPKHHKAWTIRATFAGNRPPRKYTTPNIWRHDPGWGNEAFNRTIEKLELFLPNGHAILMAGMERYNFFVEAVQSKRTRGGARIKAFWFCGKHPGENIVEMYRVAEGRIIRDRKPWGREWGGGPTKGWKKGVPGKTISTVVS